MRGGVQELRMSLFGPWTRFSLTKGFRQGPCKHFIQVRWTMRGANHYLIDRAQELKILTKESCGLSGLFKDMTQSNQLKVSITLSVSFHSSLFYQGDMPPFSRYAFPNLAYPPFTQISLSSMILASHSHWRRLSLSFLRSFSIRMLISLSITLIGKYGLVKVLLP